MDGCQNVLLAGKIPSAENNSILKMGNQYPA